MARVKIKKQLIAATANTASKSDVIANTVSQLRTQCYRLQCDLANSALSSQEKQSAILQMRALDLKQQIDAIQYGRKQPLTHEERKLIRTLTTRLRTYEKHITEIDLFIAKVLTNPLLLTYSTTLNSLDADTGTRVKKQLIYVEKFFDALKSNDAKAINRFIKLLNNPETAKILRKGENPAIVRFFKMAMDTIANFFTHGAYRKQLCADSLAKRGTPHYYLTSYGLFATESRKILLQAKKSLAQKQSPVTPR